MENRAQQLIHVYYLPLRWGFKGPMEGTSQYQQFLQTSIIGVAYIYTLFNYRRLYLDPIFLIIPHSCVFCLLQGATSLERYWWNTYANTDGTSGGTDGGVKIRLFEYHGKIRKDLAPNFPRNWQNTHWKRWEEGGITMGNSCESNKVKLLIVSWSTGFRWQEVWEEWWVVYQHIDVNR